MRRSAPESNDTAAHIHCCAPLGTNAGVATTRPAFLDFPLGVTSGTYSSTVFDLTQPGIYNPDFIMLEGGLAQAEAALIAGIEGGQTYFTSIPSIIPAERSKPAVSRARAGQSGYSQFGAARVWIDLAA